MTDQPTNDNQLEQELDEATSAAVEEEAKTAVKQQEPEQASRTSISLMDTKASTLLDPNAYAQMKIIANDFVKSGALPASIKNASQMLLVLQAGYEMRMRPVESINSLYIVNGVINVWGKAVTRRLREHGWQLQYEDKENECKATITKGDEKYTETYKFEDAEASGYTTDSGGKLKVGWKEGINRRLKLRYGALSVLIKSYVPEVLGASADIVEVYQDVTPVDEAEASRKEKEKASIEKAVKSSNKKEAAEEDFKPTPIGVSAS